MKKILMQILTITLTWCILITNIYANEGSEIQINAPSAILMDFSTGTVLYEKDADCKLPMASVTKIMTMLLAMEEIEAGRMKYDDIITASAYAKSFGGSTIFLDEGEQMTVEDILKGIAVASGNDASVAMAEHIAGTEALFVERMNKKAALLKMNNTNFINCNGLDADGHYSSARDIAIMSRELMKHDDIFKFTTIWTDTLRNGNFNLSNTNKLVRFYDGATGLKTGSTGKAKFCISATAKRGNMHLISVIMAAETSKSRQKDASDLLNYGFSLYDTKDVVKQGTQITSIKPEKSTIKKVGIIVNDNYSFVHKKTDNVKIDKKVSLKKLKVPAKKGEEAGTLDIFINDKKTAQLKLVYLNDVPKSNFWYEFKKLFDMWV